MIKDHNVFFHGNGRPIKDFKASWKKACESAGVPNMLFHDLRRTAVRNLIRADVPQTVAKRISGHESDSVFERYNITSSAGIQKALGKVDLADKLSNFEYRSSKIGFSAAVAKA
jgi:integrase